jgi:hypothetical protein
MRKFIVIGLVLALAAAAAAQEVRLGGAASHVSSTLNTHTVILTVGIDSAIATSGFGFSLQGYAGNAPWFFYFDLGAAVVTASSTTVNDGTPANADVEAYDTGRLVSSNLLGVAYRLSLGGPQLLLVAGIGADIVSLTAESTWVSDVEYFVLGPALAAALDVPLNPKLAFYFALSGSFGLIRASGGYQNSFVDAFTLKPSAGVRLRLN